MICSETREGTFCRRSTEALYHLREKEIQLMGAPAPIDLPQLHPRLLRQRMLKTNLSWNTSVFVGMFVCLWSVYESISKTSGSRTTSWRSPRKLPRKNLKTTRTVTSQRTTVCQRYEKHIVPQKVSPPCLPPQLKLVWATDFSTASLTLSFPCLS